MIHEIAAELLTHLKSKACPITVVDGPEPTATATWGRERIVLEDDGADSFGPPRMTHVNPKHLAVVTASYKATIYAKSAAPGAGVFEHRRRARHIADLVVVGLFYVAAARGHKDAFSPSSGRFITPEDVAASERPAGAAYEIAFTFERSVQDYTWAKVAASEFTLLSTSIASTTEVSFAGGADDDDDPNTVPALAETV